MDTVTFDEAECIAETDMALLVRIDVDDEDERWVPKSVVAEESEVQEKGDAGELVVAEWWAKKAGLE